MALNHIVLFIRQPAGLIQNILRYTDFTDIVKQRRLADHLNGIHIHIQGFRNGRCVIRHIIGMAEGIMILCVNSRRKGKYRGFIFLVDMLRGI